VAGAVIKKRLCARSRGGSAGPIRARRSGIRARTRETEGSRDRNRVFLLFETVTRGSKEEYREGRENRKGRQRGLAGTES